MAFDMGDYVDVAERLRLFRDRYPEGSLQPWNPDRPFEVVTANSLTFVVCVEAAYRTPDDPRPGVGVAWEPLPGKTPYTKDSELMNAQTSAWGRAIVAVLAADTKKIASAQEVRNRQDRDAETTSAPPVGKAAARLAVVNSLESLKNFTELAAGYAASGAWSVEDLREFNRAALSARVRLSPDQEPA